MRTFYLILSSLILITSIFSQDKTFKLKDGTVVIGTIQEETNSTLIVQTKFGLVTINKSELIQIQYEVKLKSGETLVGIKIGENPESIIIQEITIKEFTLSATHKMLSVSIITSCNFIKLESVNVSWLELSKYKFIAVLLTCIVVLLKYFINKEFPKLFTINSKGVMVISLISPL